MEELKGLIDIVNRHKTKQIEIIDQHTDENSKIYRLYEGIAEEKYTDEHEARDDLYPEGGTEQAFKKLKYRLKKRLINTLFFIDVNKAQFTEHFKAYHQCFTKWAASRLLLARNQREIAVEQMEKLIPIAEKYEMIDLLMLVSRDLRNHYAFYNIDQSRRKRFNEMLGDNTGLLQAEIEVEKLYSDIISTHALQHTTPEDHEEKELIGLYERLEELQKTGDTYRLNLYGFYARSSVLELLKRFEDLSSLCDQAIAFFKNKKHQSKLPVVNFYIKKIIALSRLMKHEQALSVIAKAEDLLEEYSYNYYLLEFYHLILLVHSKQYTAGFKLLQDLLHRDEFETLPDNFKEHFRIANAYMHFLLEIGKVDQKTEKPFKIFKFLNEVPIYSKDKRGLNVTILIVHILFLLQKRRYSDIIERMESLQQYSYRYLSKGDTVRSNCFIKMILQLPKADFHPKRTHLYAEKYYKKLMDHPLEMAEQPSEIELIPYEDLWDLILELLKENYAETGRLPRRYTI